MILPLFNVASFKEIFVSIGTWDKELFLFSASKVLLVIISLEVSRSLLIFPSAKVIIFSRILENAFWKSLAIFFSCLFFSVNPVSRKKNYVLSWFDRKIDVILMIILYILFDSLYFLLSNVYVNTMEKRQN